MAESIGEAQSSLAMYGMTMLDCCEIVSSVSSTSTPFSPNSAPTVVLGNEQSGTLPDAIGSDDSYALLSAEAFYDSVNDIDATWVGITAAGTSSNPSNPSSIEVAFEIDLTNAGSFKHFYRINAFNYTTGVYDSLADATLSGPFGTDRIVSAVVTSNPSDYINSTNGNVSARLFVYAPKANGFYNTFETKIDDIYWIVK